MKENSIKKIKRKGFTLIELIIVIAIIGILAAIAIPKFSDATDSSKRKTDIANARIIAHAVTLLASEGKTDLQIASAAGVPEAVVGLKIQGGLPVAKSKPSTGTQGFIIKVSSGETTITNGSDTDQVYPKPSGIYAQ